MDQIVKPFDRYRLRYATTNPEGRDLTRIEFYYQETKVGQLLSGSAIGPGSFVSLRDGEIHLYFDAAMVDTALDILRDDSNLALYFVPDDRHPEREQGREGGILRESRQSGALQTPDKGTPAAALRTTG
jgi:hypothetical protein